MIEIRHKTTKAVLYRVEADTLRNAAFYKVDLVGADFRNQNLGGADFALARLEQTNFANASCIKANFYSAHLQRACLSEARLWSIDGEGADLRYTVLSKAQMYAAWLRHASLSDADLRAADLKAAYLGRASLRNANMEGVNLSEAILQGTDMSGANLSGATLCATVFAECTSLHKAIGLSQVKHVGTSSLDHKTLRACTVHLPEAFLLGIGYTETEIDLLRNLYT